MTVILYKTSFFRIKYKYLSVFKKYPTTTAGYKNIILNYKNKNITKTSQ